MGYGKKIQHNIIDFKNDKFLWLVFKAMYILKIDVNSVIFWNVDVSMFSLTSLSLTASRFRDVPPSLTDTRSRESRKRLDISRSARIYARGFRHTWIRRFFSVVSAIIDFCRVVRARVHIRPETHETTCGLDADYADHGSRPVITMPRKIPDDSGARSAIREKTRLSCAAIFGISC